MKVTVCITDTPVQYDGYAKATGIVISSEDEKINHLKAVIYDNSPESALFALQPGQTASFEALMKRADIKYGEEYDYYSSVNIFLTANIKSEIETGNITRPLSTIPERIKAVVSSKIGLVYQDGRISAFMKSLLLGDKSDFYNDRELKTSMSRAGIMHIVAVSGMHISFLIGFLRLCFGNSKRSALICLIFVWIFVFVTGAGPSAVRAGMMQSILLFAPILRRENDAVTSLMLALSVILLLNPFAILSVSLQLSFAAMAGIVLFSERLMKFLSGCFPVFSSKRAGRYLVGSVASSVSVLIFSIPITAFHFRSVQILSPAANVLVLWAVSLCFCLGYISLIFRLFAYPAAIFAKYILWVAKTVSAVPFASIYIISFFSVLWIILIYDFFISAVFSGLEAKAKIAVPVLFSAVSLAILLLVPSYGLRSCGGVVTAIDVGQGQCIAAFSGDQTVLIDCGGKNTLSSAGETAGEYLISCGRKKVDALVFTHLHDDHSNGFSDLISLVDVEKIIIPAYEDDDVNYQNVLANAFEHGINVVALSEDRTVEIGEIRLDLYPPDRIESENENCMAVRVEMNGYSFLSTGDMDKSGEKKLLEEHPDLKADLLIAGHHGSKYSSTGDFLSAVGAQDVIISSGYNTYGHPSYETLSRLESYGYSVHRTDLSGSIRFVVN